MKKIALMLVLAAVLFSLVIAESKKRPDCYVCGMWIDQHMKTRHVVIMKNNESHQFCSFACMVTFVKEHRTKIKQIRAADFETKNLIDAKKAFYVEGGDIPGVMSRVSRIAFATKEAAEKYVKVHGGTIISFDEAFAHQEKDQE